MSNIRPARRGELAQCAAIAERLPKYFTESGLAILRRDLETHEVLVADDGGIIGFVSLDRKSDAVREISWLAVDASAQSDGVGSALVEGAERLCREDNASVLEVKTLAARETTSNYDSTRRFYERHGFVLLEVIDPFPGWEPGNPCAIYVKALP